MKPADRLRDLGWYSVSDPVVYAGKGLDLKVRHIGFETFSV